MDRHARLPAGFDRGFLAGVGLKVEGHWTWSEPFLVYGVIAWAFVSLVAFGYLGGAIG